MRVRFQLRILEWMNAAMLFSLGLVTTYFPQSLSNPSLAYFREHSSLWAALFLIVGAMRIIALTINGRWNGGTPTLRFIGAALGAGIFSSIAYTFLKNTGFTYITWGATTYIFIVLGELVNSYFTTKDIANHYRYRG